MVRVELAEGREGAAMGSGQETSSTVTIELPEGFPSGIGGSPEEFAREFRLAAAIEWYREGRVSQGQAAEFAGLGRAEFLNELARAKVPAYQASVDELMEEVDRAVEAYRQRVAPDPAVEDGTT
jgi:predicted HTH domain antitoxin